MESERLDARWKTEATAAGWGPDQAEQLVASLTPGVVDAHAGLWRLGDVGFDEYGTDRYLSEQLRLPPTRPGPGVELD